LKDLIAAFFISMLPLAELRIGIIYAAARGIPFPTAFAVCLIGNVLPVPFILLFIKKIFAFLEKFKYTAKIVKKLEDRARAKSESVKTKQLIGLFAFVAIPLPGTGAWTGSLIAAMLDLKFGKSFAVIVAGVITAGMIMSLLSYLIPGLFFNF